MVHGEAAAPQPARGTRQRLSPLVHDDEAPRLDVDEGGGELLERIGRRVGAVDGDGEHQVGVADGLLRPRRQLGVGEEDQIVVRALELIERCRRLGAVELDALGQQLGDAGSVQHQRIGVGGEHAGELVEKFLGDLRATSANDGDGARARIGRRRLMTRSWRRAVAKVRSSASARCPGTSPICARTRCGRGAARDCRAWPIPWQCACRR